MDATEKIIQFESYDDLLTEIKRDMEDGDPLRCRYPVRFIMLNNFNVFTRFAQDLAFLGVQALNLEELLPADYPDGWLTTDDLKTAFKSCKDLTLVTPFSELVRFYSDSDFRGFFNDIMLIEDIDHPHKRIYVPLIGLQNRFSNYLNGFARIEESAPVWAYLEEEHKTEVFLTQIKNATNAFAQKSKIVCLNTVYDWLRFWKNQAPQTQIICSSSPIYRRNKYSVPDNIFTFKYVENAHEYIESFLGITIPFPYEKQEEKYWSQLLQDILKTGLAAFGFNSFVCSRFNFVHLEPRDIFIQWVQTETTEYDRWLMKNYFLSCDSAEKYPYLKVCFNEVSEYGMLRELPTKVAERIFYFSEPSTQMGYAAEREHLIKNSLNVICEFVAPETRDYIKNRIAEIEQNNTQLAIALCTGAFDFEKVLITAWYADKDRTGLTLEKAAEKYPALGMFLADPNTTVKAEDNWHIEYLKEYRNAKLADEYTEGIKAFISEKNHDGDSFYGWYHSFEESHNRLAQHLSSDEYRPDKIYWIDALGYEFLPYILSLIEDSGVNYRVLHSEVTRCTIPSATAQNRFDDVIKFGELDALAHDSVGYKKNATLVKELQVLQSKIMDIITSNAYGEHTIAIVSDHGLSCLSRKLDSLKYDAKVEHDGRYIKVAADGKLYHDADYVVHTNENDGERYKVALTHASLGRKPVHEVHGGCTPEEVLVPYIIITNKKQNLVRYNYTLLTKEIEVSNPTITVNVMPQPLTVRLHINGQDFKMIRADSKWSALVNGLDEGEYKAEVTIPGGTSFNATIKVIGTGFGGNDFLDF